MLKGLFGGGSGEQEVLKEQSAEAAAQKDEIQQTALLTEEKKTNGAKKDTSTIPLEVNTVFSSLPPMSVAEKRASRDRLVCSLRSSILCLGFGLRLRAIDTKEVSKVFREEARNTLEAYLYKLRDLLEDRPDSPFIKCSKPSERQAISFKLEDTIAWLHEEAETAETSALREKRGVLECVYVGTYVLVSKNVFRLLERPIVHRYKEIEDFPEVLNNSQKWNWSTRLFLAEARTNLTAEAAVDIPSKWTSEELDALEAALKGHEVWLNEGVEKQKRTPMNENPAIQTKEMRERAKILELHLQRLVKRKVPKVKKSATSSQQSSSEPKQSSSDREARHDEL